MTNNRPQLAGAIPSASRLLHVHNRTIALRILFDKVKTLRDLQYHGMLILELRIHNLLSEIENIALNIALNDGSPIPQMMGSAIHRAYMKFKRLQFIFDELQSPSAARRPISKFEGTIMARIPSGAADDI